MTGQAGTGADSAATPPQNDFVLSEDPRQVQAPVPANADPAPKNAEVQDHDDTEEDQDAETIDQSDGKKRRRGGFQKKIAARDAEITRLNAELAKLKPIQSPELKTDDATEAEPTPDKFENWGDYTKALTKWTASNAVKEAEVTRDKRAKEEAANAAFKTKVEKFNEGQETARTVYPDYDDVLSEFEDVPVNPAIRAALVESDMGADVAYYLAKNAEEFNALNQPNVDFVQTMKAFGRIEAKIEAGKQAPVNIAAVKTTNAPPPIKPVNKGKSAGTGYSEDMSFEDFQAWEKRQKAR